MIGVAIDRAFVEGLDSESTYGRMVIVQIGPLTLTWYIGWRQ